MDIKDFKVGQEAFAYYEDFGRREFRTTRGIVTDVGRKYVTVHFHDGRIARKYYKYYEAEEYLTENIEYGIKEKLFISEQALSNYKEYDELCKNIGAKFSFYKNNDFSLKQLRAIWRILNIPKSGEIPEVDGYMDIIAALFGVVIGQPFQIEGDKTDSLWRFTENGIKHCYALRMDDRSTLLLNKLLTGEDKIIIKYAKE